MCVPISRQSDSSLKTTSVNLMEVLEEKSGVHQSRRVLSSGKHDFMVIHLVVEIFQSGPKGWSDRSNRLTSSFTEPHCLHGYKPKDVRSRMKLSKLPGFLFARTNVGNYMKWKQKKWGQLLSSYYKLNHSL